MLDVTEGATPVAMGRLEVLQPFRTAPVRDEHTVRVFVPDAARGSGPLPVLYLMDGQNLFDGDHRGGSASWGVDRTMERLVTASAIEPWMVVAVDHAGVGRLSEYSMWDEPRAGVRAAGVEFARWFLEHLMPWVGRTYSVRTAPEWTAIGGSSMGGLFALSLASRAPRRFGRVLGMSPTVMWGSHEIVHRWRTAVAPPYRIYLDAGREERFDAGGYTLDYGHSVEAFGRHLRTIGYGDEQLCVVIDPAGTHDEATWRRRLPAALAWLLH